MKKIDITALQIDVRDIPEGTDIVRYCVENIDECYTSTEASFDNIEEARKNLDKYEIHTVNVSNRTFIIAYVIEIYEVDENGDFVEGCDYDWNKLYIFKDGEVKEVL